MVIRYSTIYHWLMATISPWASSTCLEMTLPSKIFPRTSQTVNVSPQQAPSHHQRIQGRMVTPLLLLCPSHWKAQKHQTQWQAGVPGTCNRHNPLNQAMASTHTQTTKSNVQYSTHVSLPVPRRTRHQTAAQAPTSILKSVNPIYTPLLRKPSVQMPTPSLLTTRLRHSSFLREVVDGKLLSVLLAGVRIFWQR
jgi:hypothetical protein